MGYCPKCEQWHSEINSLCPKCGVLLVDSQRYEKAKREKKILPPVKPDFLLKKRKELKILKTVGLLLLIFTISFYVIYIFIHPLTTIIMGIFSLSVECVLYSFFNNEYLETFDQSQFVYGMSSSSESSNESGVMSKVGVIFLIISGISVFLLINFFILGMSKNIAGTLEYNNFESFMSIHFLITAIMGGVGLFLCFNDKPKKTVDTKTKLETDINAQNNQPVVTLDWKSAYVRCPYCNSYCVHFINISPMKNYGKRWTCNNCKRNF